MKKKVLKPFDLKRAKAGAEVCTRDERPTRIICFDRTHDYYPIVALFHEDGQETFDCFTIKGRKNYVSDEEHFLDLMMVEYE